MDELVQVPTPMDDKRPLGMLCWRVIYPDGLNLRVSPSRSARVVGGLDQGACVLGRRLQNGFVGLESPPGWVCSHDPDGRPYLEEVALIWTAAGAAAYSAGVAPGSLFSQQQLTGTHISVQALIDAGHLQPEASEDSSDSVIPEQLKRALSDQGISTEWRVVWPAGVNVRSSACQHSAVIGDLPQGAALAQLELKDGFVRHETGWSAIWSLTDGAEFQLLKRVDTDRATVPSQLQQQLTYDLERVLSGVSEPAARSSSAPGLLRVAVMQHPAMDQSSIKGTVQALTRSGVQVQTVAPNQVANGCLSDYEVLIFPGGSHLEAMEQLGKDGDHAIRTYVGSGGGFIGICGGAFFAVQFGLVAARVQRSNYNTPIGGLVRGLSVMEATTGFEEVFDRGLDGIRLNFQYGPIITHTEIAGPALSWSPAVTKNAHLPYVCSAAVPLAVFGNDIMTPVRHRMEANALKVAARRPGEPWECVGDMSSCPGAGYSIGWMNKAGSNECEMCKRPFKVDCNVPESEWPPADVMLGACAILRSTYGNGKVILFAPHPEITDTPDAQHILKQAVEWVAPT